MLIQSRVSEIKAFKEGTFAHNPFKSAKVKKKQMNRPTLNETKTNFENIKLDGISIMDMLKDTMGDGAIEWIDELVNGKHDREVEMLLN